MEKISMDKSVFVINNIKLGVITDDGMHLLRNNCQDNYKPYFLN